MRAKRNLSIEMAAESAATQAELEKEGFRLRERPGFEIPKLPIRLTELNDDKLMALFSALTRWTDFIAERVAMAEVDERAAEAVLNKAQALVLLRDWAGGRDDRVTMAKAQRDIDPVVEAQQAEFDQRHAYRKMLAVLFTSTERDAAVVSRELTRRVGRREDHDRRTARWAP